jgi:nitroreductase
MTFTKPATEIIKQRYSCRSYKEEQLDDTMKNNMERFITENRSCPFNSAIRFKFVSSEKGDSEALKELGTYGFIRNPAGFIIGGMKQSKMCFEDFGYLMEKNILYATGIGLGTCWLGGSFKRSTFTKRMDVRENEVVPAVASMGYVAENKTNTDRVLRFAAGAVKRKHWNELFFNDNFNNFLDKKTAGLYADAIEMTRLAPSASNKQPWRIVKEKDKNIFHFYLERSKSYGVLIKFLRYSDLQRIDMGIAMSHFELAADEVHLTGTWKIADPKIASREAKREYVATWVGK